MEMNAREAMHLIELRSTPQGHPAYRRVATDMYRLIAEEAGHRDIAASMSFVDLGVTDLGRLDAEQRAEARAGGRHSQANADAERGEGGGGSRTLRALSPRPPAG